MHFSKTYAQLLLSLPPELRDNAIQYRQLKKVINQIVHELSSLGLNPEVLHELIESSSPSSPSSSSPAPDTPSTSRGDAHHHHFPKVVYELGGSPDRIEPQLRIRVSVPVSGSGSGGNSLLRPPSPSWGGRGRRSSFASDGGRDRTRLLWSLQHRVPSSERLVGNIPTTDATASTTQEQEVVIPLIHDTQFYNMLATTLESVSAHLNTVHADFLGALKGLGRSISDAAGPASVVGGFMPHSRVTTHAGSVRVKSGDLKSDLYSWREIFQLYLEAEVFESVSETTRGERSVEESERRLKMFAERVSKRGLGDSRQFKMKQSGVALETFLGLNLFILNIKKFSYANSEATRKILKKHAKRTALPLPGLPSSMSISPHGLSLPSPSSSTSPFTFTFTTSLPRLLVQALGETLLPIIPAVDDYACLICTSLAFKPIRLSCAHLFCVRCLVKMQKRGRGSCPVCRAPSVLVANRSNVDWALLNFMQDWFPEEAREKLASNEKEAAEEAMKELGLDPNQSCISM
ncbi:hypothetical protein B0H34DRAFT_660898 [Crassisporium funariophilum]|nr:hypothetical protein B0H34DRAFT_660898 [Crassisporium funariophilum]